MPKSSLDSLFVLTIQSALCSVDNTYREDGEYLLREADLVEGERRLRRLLLSRHDRDGVLGAEPPHFLLRTLPEFGREQMAIEPEALVKWTTAS